MPRRDTCSLAAALALCFASGAVLAEEHRGRPDFKKQSMTRSSAAAFTRASKPETAALPATRSGRRPATKASTASLGKERMARLDAPSTHRAPRGDEQPAARATGLSAAKTGRETAGRAALRSARTPSKRSAHAAKEHLSVRTTRGTWIDWLFGR